MSAGRYNSGDRDRLERNNIVKLETRFPANSGTRKPVKRAYVDRDTVFLNVQSIDATRGDGRLTLPPVPELFPLTFPRFVFTNDVGT